MSDTIKAKITDDMKAAMRSKEMERLVTIRMMLAAFKQREVDERITLSDEQIIALLDKMVKQRRESIAQYQAGDRPDLAAKEEQEIQIIQTYMPAQLSPAEVEEAIKMAIQESGAQGAKDMGKVMGLLKSKIQGRADMTAVSNKVKESLSAS